MVSKKTQYIRWKRKEILTSKRQCINCEKETEWFYNKTLGHSECQICGYR